MNLSEDNVPLVEINERIIVKWPMDDGDFQEFSGEVIKIKYRKISNSGDKFKYFLKFDDDGAIKSTKLKNLMWKKLSHSEEKGEKSEKHKLQNTAICRNVRLKSELPQHRYILAPMVGGSELAFRILCRRYGAQLAYTPMINSEKFATDPDYRAKEFQTTPFDRPLVAHFSANNPDTFLKAAKFVEHQCDAIDLNLGCPQRVAHTGHFGSYLLDDSDRPLILNMIRKLKDNLSIPIFVKIRLLDALPDTILLCRQLIEAGASLIAIHARYRVNLVGRTGAGARDGPAMLDQVAVIKREFPHFPIIANGNIRSWEEAEANLVETQADGVMSAEGLLDNPALFSPTLLSTQNSEGTNTIHGSVANTDNGSGVSTTVNKLVLAIEYINLVKEYPVALKSVIFHIRRMCREELTTYQLMEDCLTATDISVIETLLNQAIEYQNNNTPFVFDKYKAKRAKEALERKKLEEGKRKRFEERMIRKAKREGKELNFYLNQGAENPTSEILSELRQLPKETAFELWKVRHSQHCYAFHFEPGGCPRDRTCSFLHADANITEAVAYG